MAKTQEQEQAKILRRQGLSLNTISKQLNVSKGSVSNWVQGIEVPKTPTEKHCPKCKTSDLSRFGPNKTRPDGLQTYCRECIKQYRRPRNRSYHMKHLYDLTEQQYETRLAQQRGNCLLCGDPPRQERLVVDHDHSTEMVRGLIHRECNLLLGYAGDRVDRLLAAVHYLKKFELSDVSTEAQHG